MKWDRYRIKTTTEAEDLISCTLAECGIEGIEIEDNIPLTKEDTAKMFIDILPELPQDEGIAYVSFYLEAGEDHTEILNRVKEELADVLICSQQLLDKLGLDADEIVNMKMTQNEAKYPVEKAKGKALKYDQL